MRDSDPHCTNLPDSDQDVAAYKTRKSSCNRLISPKYGSLSFVKFRFSLTNVFLLYSSFVNIILLEKLTCYYHNFLYCVEDLLGSAAEQYDCDGETPAEKVDGYGELGVSARVSASFGFRNPEI